MMRIEVTQEDIEKGDRNMCYSCPVALAVRRALGVAVAIETNRIWLDGKYVTIPLIVKEFIGDFDTEEPVTPFIFELEGL